jgi:hypothetical protein
MDEYEKHRLAETQNVSERGVEELIAEIEALVVLPDVWQLKFEAIFLSMLKKNQVYPRQYSIVFFHEMYARDLGDVKIAKFREWWKAAEEKITSEQKSAGGEQ